MKIVNYHGHSPGELFDLQKDPYEFDNLWENPDYADGTEELYAHRKDPHEWHNLAGDPVNQKVINRLKKWLPETEAPPAPNMKRPK